MDSPFVTYGWLTTSLFSGIRTSSQTSSVRKLSLQIKTSVDQSGSFVIDNGQTMACEYIRLWKSEGGLQDTFKEAS
jgi:hypothetical protein